MTRNRNGEPNEVSSPVGNYIAGNNEQFPKRDCERDGFADKQIQVAKGGKYG